MSKIKTLAELPAKRSSALQATAQKPVRAASIGKQLDVIDAEFKPVVRRGGVKSLGKFVTTKRVAVTGALVALGLAGANYLDEIEAISEDASNPAFRAAAMEALDKINSMWADTGLDGHVDDADGKIAGYEKSEVSAYRSAVDAASIVILDAIASAGGASRLAAITRFIALDSDLREEALASLLARDQISFGERGVLS